MLTRIAIVLGAVCLLLGGTVTSPATSAVDMVAGAADAKPRVGFGRWMDLRIGMTAEEAIATGKVARDATSCGETGMRPPWADRGYLWWSEADRLRGVTLFTRRDRTAQDTGVGSTLRSLRRAYPGLSPVRVRRIEGYRLPYVEVQRRARTITFQFATDTRPGPKARVRVMSLSRTAPLVMWTTC